MGEYVFGIPFFKTTVVTGCTDGIGKAIVEEFASKGLNVVLISRTLAKLEEQAKQLESKYKIQTKVIQLDFSTEDLSVFDKVKSEIENLEIGILGNGYSFLTTSQQRWNGLWLSRIFPFAREEEDWRSCSY